MNSTIKVIQPSEILDGANGNCLRRAISDAVESGIKTVLIDCQDVEFMDSAGLSALVMSLRTVQDAGSRLLLCSINTQIRMLLELTSMDDVFEVVASQAEFN